MPFEAQADSGEGECIAQAKGEEAHLLPSPLFFSNYAAWLIFSLPPGSILSLSFTKKAELSLFYLTTTPVLFRAVPSYPSIDASCKNNNFFRLKRRQMSAKQISTASEEVPFSTSDESEHNLDASPIEFAKYPPGA